MKRILGYLVLWAFPLFCFGQDGIDAINDIKLSGKYFTAEATASTEDDAKKLALMGLMERLSAYCEEMEIAEIGEDRVREALLSKNVKRGESALVMVYVASGSSALPNIIKQINEIDTYASMQYLLEKAMDNGLVEDWGKLRTMSDPNACYLIMLNIDRQIVGVLSPMQNGARINVKTGAVMDTESMNKFTNCIPIGILLK